MFLVSRCHTYIEAAQACVCGFKCCEPFEAVQLSVNASSKLNPSSPKNPVQVDHQMRLQLKSALINTLPPPLQHLHIMAYPFVPGTQLIRSLNASLHTGSRHVRCDLIEEDVVKIWLLKWLLVVWNSFFFFFFWTVCFGFSQMIKPLCEQQLCAEQILAGSWHHCQI